MHQLKPECKMKTICLMMTSALLLLCPQVWAQAIGSAECGIAQYTVQEAVIAGQPYKNHGQMRRTAARAMDTLRQGMISAECES